MQNVPREAGSNKSPVILTQISGFFRVDHVITVRTLVVMAEIALSDPVDM